MAFFPCSNHHAPYRGPSWGVYPAIVTGGEAERRKLRMCEPCFDEYVGVAEGCMVEVIDEESAVIAPPCWSCSMPCRNGDSSSIFVNVYPRGSEPRSFYGRTCETHRESAVATFLLR